MPENRSPITPSERIHESMGIILAAIRGISPKSRAKEAEKVLEIYEDFFLQPASSKSSHHGCHPGGLVVHSCRVLETALKIAKGLNHPSLDLNSVIIVSVFHDLGKIKEYKNTSSGYRRVRNLLPHSAESIRLIQEAGMSLTEEEFQAILMHNGLYTPMGEEIKGQESPLTMVLHWADLWSAFILKA